MNAGQPFLVHTESSMAWGGQEIRIHTELKRLKTFGWRVELWAPKRSDVYLKSKAVQIPVECVAFRRSWDPGSIRLVRKLVREKRPDIIVTHSSIDSWVVGLATRGMSDRLNIVRMRHLSTPVKNILPYRWFADAVGTTSEDIRRILISRGLSQDCVATLPTGVDLQRFHPNPGVKSELQKKFGLPLDRPVVGGVFVIRSWKGIYDFVKIAATVPNAHFVVVGEGPSREAMMKSAAEQGVADRMMFTGHVEAVEEILWAMDVFLFPSTANEGIPQALLQAQGCGVPAVISDLPSLREAAGAALVCPVGNIQMFSDAIAKMLIDSDRARAISSAGLEWVNRFDQEKMMANIDAFYRRIIASRT